MQQEANTNGHSIPAGHIHRKVTRQAAVPYTGAQPQKASITAAAAPEGQAAGIPYPEQTMAGQRMQAAAISAAQPAVASASTDAEVPSSAKKRNFEQLRGPKAHTGGNRDKKRRGPAFWVLLGVLCLVLVLVATALITTRGTFDFVAPVADGLDVYGFAGEELQPSAFLFNVFDGTLPMIGSADRPPLERGMTEALVLNPGDELPADANRSTPYVTAAFERAPDFNSPAAQEVVVRLTDKAGHKTDVQASYTPVQGNRDYTVEAGSDPALVTPACYVQLPAGITAVFSSDPAGLDFHVANTTYELPLFIGNYMTLCKLHVQDTTPPAATPVEHHLWTIDQPEAADFVTDIQDATAVSISFDGSYTFDSPGSFEVALRLEDSAGNVTTLTSMAHVQHDDQAPAITGATNRTALLGSRINYRNGITVTDNRDEDIELEVDSSAVNTTVAGTYPVTYRAVDASGNEASVTVNITLLPVDEATVNAKADEILASITNENMSKIDKARAIYDWVTTNVRYSNSGDKSGILQGAYYAFWTGKGDCYTFYAAGEILLTRAGIDNMGVERIASAPTRHYWSIINVGDGWYHFDTCLAPITIDKFMFTESQAQRYTERIRGMRANYYDYDHEQYPQVVQ